MNNIFKRIQDLVNQAKSLHAEERQMTLRSIDLVGELAQLNSPVNLNMSGEDFARSIGLSYSTYLKRAQVFRVIRRFPAFKEMLMTGDTEVSTVGLVAPKITDANARVIAEGIKGKSRRQAELFLSRVNFDGTLKDKEGTVEVKLVFTESEWQAIERAREVLAFRGKVPRTSEIILTAVNDSLEKRDPTRKAERAQERAAKKGLDLVEVASQIARPAVDIHGKRTAIPAAIKHARQLQDGGQCTWILADGARCPDRTCVEMEHKEAVARGGYHTLRTMTTYCMAHNKSAAERIFGREFMERFGS